MKPDFSAQTGEPMTRNEKNEWFRNRVKEFRDKGATHMRAAWDDSFEPPLYLVEGWLVEPEDFPPPFFHLTHERASDE